MSTRRRCFFSAAAAALAAAALGGCFSVMPAAPRPGSPPMESLTAADDARARGDSAAEERALRSAIAAAPFWLEPRLRLQDLYLETQRGYRAVFEAEEELQRSGALGLGALLAARVSYGERRSAAAELVRRRPDLRPWMMLFDADAFDRMGFDVVAYGEAQRALAALPSEPRAREAAARVVGGVQWIQFRYLGASAFAGMPSDATPRERVLRAAALLRRRDSGGREETDADGGARALAALKPWWDEMLRDAACVGEMIQIVDEGVPGALLADLEFALLKVRRGDADAADRTAASARSALAARIYMHRAQPELAFAAASDALRLGRRDLATYACARRCAAALREWRTVESLDAEARALFATDRLRRQRGRVAVDADFDESASGPASRGARALLRAGLLDEAAEAGGDGADEALSALDVEAAGRSLLPAAASRPTKVSFAREAAMLQKLAEPLLRPGIERTFDAPAANRFGAASWWPRHDFADGAPILLHAERVHGKSTTVEVLRVLETLRLADVAPPLELYLVRRVRLRGPADAPDACSQPPTPGPRWIDVERVERLRKRITAAVEKIQIHDPPQVNLSLIPRRATLEECAAPMHAADAIVPLLAQAFRGRASAVGGAVLETETLVAAERAAAAASPPPFTAPLRRVLRRLEPFEWAERAQAASLSLREWGRATADAQFPEASLAVLCDPDSPILGDRAWALGKYMQTCAALFGPDSTTPRLLADRLLMPQLRALSAEDLRRAGRALLDAYRL